MRIVKSERSHQSVHNFQIEIHDPNTGIRYESFPSQEEAEAAAQMILSHTPRVFNVFVSEVTRRTLVSFHKVASQPLAVSRSCREIPT